MAKYSADQRPKKTPKAAKPWDRPPSSGHRDLDEEPVYAAVGLALTNWGLVEHQLGEIFLALIGGRSYEAMMAFGSVMSGRGRSDMIEAAARAYFTTRQGPEYLETKKNLSDHMIAINRFSERRNEIAHGVVAISLGENWADEDRFDASFVLRPSFFAAKKRGLESMPGGHIAMPPTYQYSSKEIAMLAAKFKALVKPSAALAREIRRQRHLEK